ncbi:hypothetical protein BN1221_01314 [Brenneria goodwinii]|uniref:Uncharacterized protein n=1 Tax=Brenneria goodwinii TaxID=1109412 RepID=A0A0G4JT35_9GAMM|nr:hypothetical protein BN1221_01314 [Brenneria goodwinii]
MCCGNGNFFHAKTSIISYLYSPFSSDEYQQQALSRICAQQARP